MPWRVCSLALAGTKIQLKRKRTDEGQGFCLLEGFATESSKALVIKSPLDERATQVESECKRLETRNRGVHPKAAALSLEAQDLCARSFLTR